MNVHFPVPRRKWPARLVNLAVVVVVLALAAATFVLSYSGVHEIALQAGVSVRLARIYPGIFNAVLVIACVAAVTLRDARWWARSYAWLVIVLVAAVVGAADVAHAMNLALQHRTMEGVVAAVPWALALLGFSLMLTMFRHSRAQHAATAAAGEATPAGPAGTAPIGWHHVTAPALPAGDDHAPTLVVPAVTEADAPRRASDDDGDTAGEGTAQESIATPDVTAAVEAPTADEPAPLRYAIEPERPAWAFEHIAAQADTAADASVDPFPPEPPAGWHERIADSGDPDATRNDYWDADDRGATVPWLNRVRATPIPPEEDEE